MSVERVDAVVVGAGAAGLAAAVELARRGVETLVLEARDAPGGVARSERVEGYLLERGPNTFQAKAPAARFLRENALLDRLLAAAPASRLRYVVRGGRLLALPLGPLAFARSPILSPRGKLRLLAEPFVRRGDPTGESVAEFVRRRLGGEALERLVAPFLTGVYAGDPERLGAEAVFPSLVAAERRSGSIVRGLLAQALRGGRERGLRGSWSHRAGLGGFAAELAASLGPGRVRLGHRVEAVARDGEGLRLEVAAAGGGGELRCRALVVATAAPEAAALVEGLDPELASTLSGVRYAPVVSVSLGVDPAQVREPIEGFGFLVPEGEGGDLLGCLFPSRLFPGRAPEGRELLTALLGGARRPEAAERDEAELLGGLFADLDRVLGLGKEPRVLAITRWPRAVPQPGREHPRLVARVRERLARQPGLVLAGAYLEGVAFGDALASGARAGAEVAERVAKSRST